MAAYVFKDVYFVLNSVDLSDRVKQVTLNMQVEPQDASSVAATTANGLLNTRIFLPGLRTWDMEVDFLQDFASGKVDATVQAIVAGGAGVTISFRPTVAVQSTNNPTYSGSVFVESYGAVSGDVGTTAVAKIKLKPTTSLTRTAT